MPVPLPVPTMQVYITLGQFVQLRLGKLQLFLGHFTDTRMRRIAGGFGAQLHGLAMHRELMLQIGRRILIAGQSLLFAVGRLIRIALVTQFGILGLRVPRDAELRLCLASVGYRSRSSSSSSSCIVCTVRQQEFHFAQILGVA